MAACSNEYEPGPMAKVGLTLARLAMGGLFVFSGSAKLGFVEHLRGIGFLEGVANAGVDPTQFAATVKAFAILHTDLIPFVVFTLPWLEILCGVALIIGLMPRAAASLVNLMLMAFIAAMVSVMLRDIDVECTCFGKFLGGKVGWMSLARNGVLMGIMTPVALWGGGYLALANLWKRPSAAA